MVNVKQITISSLAFAFAKMARKQARFPRSATAIKIL